MKAVKRAIRMNLSIIVLLACGNFAMSQQSDDKKDHIYLDKTPLRYVIMDSKPLVLNGEPSSKSLYLPKNHAPGYFCRQEVKIEKQSGLPFTFRLGDTDKVNALEGKQASWLNPLDSPIK